MTVPYKSTFLFLATTTPARYFRLTSRTGAASEPFAAAKEIGTHPATN